MRRGVRQDPQRAVGAAHARHAELQHVHLAQAQEQEAAAIPRGDMGRGGRVHEQAARGGGQPRGALVRAARPRLAPRAARARAHAHAPGENAHRLASFSEVHGHVRT